MAARPASIDDTIVALAALAAQGYVCGRPLGTVAFLSLTLGKPLFFEGEAGVDARVKRKEDKRFITGKGKYTNDFRMENPAYAPRGGTCLRGRDFVRRARFLDGRGREPCLPECGTRSGRVVEPRARSY